jgi:hypothetical protein
VKAHKKRIFFGAKTLTAQHTVSCHATLPLKRLMKCIFLSKFSHFNTDPSTFGKIFQLGRSIIIVLKKKKKMNEKRKMEEIKSLFFNIKIY